MSPFELFSCCSCHVKCPSEMSAILVFTTKTTQPRPQVFSVNGALTCKGLHFNVISSLNTNFYQIWSSVTGYDELWVCIYPIRIGEIFWWIINENKFIKIWNMFLFSKIDKKIILYTWVNKHKSTFRILFGDIGASSRTPTAMLI